MKRYFSVVLILLSACMLAISCGGPSDEPSSESTEQPAVEAPDQPTGERARTPALAVVDEWAIDRNDGLPLGSLTLAVDKTYSLTEYQDSSTMTTVTGTYQFSAGTRPFSIDFIPSDDPEAPGAKQSAVPGIFRFLQGGKAEIRISDTDQRPAEFAEAGSDENTLILSRK
jgi:hypothetical protein